MGEHRRAIIIAASIASTCVLVALGIFLIRQSAAQTAVAPTAIATTNDTVTTTTPVAHPSPPKPYIAPKVIKAIYVTASTALSPRMNDLRKLIKDTELNAVVINVNDVSLAILDNPKMIELVKSLDADGVHTIARLVDFQNEPLVAAHPELAVKTASGAVWKDEGGHRWIDPANKQAWKEVATTANHAADIGFRELNFDYIRFPSDGAVVSAVFPAWDKKNSREQIIEAYAKYLHDTIKPTHPDVLLTADIFAYSILVNDDTHIGQKFPNIAENFDAIAPMVYPSHYRTGNFGFKNPAAYPYDVVFGTMKVAKEKLVAANEPNVVLRPWLQDFNLGAVYTPDMVRKQMKATTDAGFENGWMLWNPRNVYSATALKTE